MDLVGRGARFERREQEVHLAASEAALQLGDARAAELRLSRAAQLGDYEIVQAQRARIAGGKFA